MGNPVVHFEIGGKNGKKLQGFYASQFGWKIDANNPMKYGVVDTRARGKTRGIQGGVFTTPAEGPSQVVTVYIEVASINPVLKRLEKAGGKVVMPRMVLPGMVTMAQFTDPAGNLIGLVESEIPPAAQPAAGKVPAKKRAASKAPPKRAPVKKKAPKPAAAKKKTAKRRRAGARPAA